MLEKVIVTRDGQSRDFQKFLGRAKNRQESLHSRLKAFQVLGCRFRHGKGTKTSWSCTRFVSKWCVLLCSMIWNAGIQFSETYSGTASKLTPTIPA
ncbi:hypothetical protein ACHAWF_007038 [Thalassiosira exigua]